VTQSEHKQGIHLNAVIDNLQHTPGTLPPFVLVEHCSLYCCLQLCCEAVISAFKLCFYKLLEPVITIIETIRLALAMGASAATEQTGHMWISWYTFWFPHNLTPGHYLNVK
jgi:hypothetical protein